MENTFTKIEKIGKVLYEKNSWFHEVEDNQNGPVEIAFILYDGLYNIYTEKEFNEVSSDEKVMCKIRTAPKKFDKLYMANSREAVIVYWSTFFGWHIMKPMWKEKAGVYTLDRQETITGIIKKARQEGADVYDEELERAIESIKEKKTRIYYHEFFDHGYIWDRDLGQDWSNVNIYISYFKDTFKIAGQVVDSIKLRTCHSAEVYESNYKNTLAGGEWTAREFADFICALDLYDTIVRILYRDIRGNVIEQSVRFNDNKICWCNDLLGAGRLLLERYAMDSNFRRAEYHVQSSKVSFESDN